MLGGLDPSGAGLQADIETCQALRCHALSVATSFTIQNTRAVESVITLNPTDIIRQARHLLTDVRPIAACKIGFLPNVESVQAVANIIDTLPVSTPICLDPVVRASSGTALASEAVTNALLTLLLPRMTLIKPNLAEARALTMAGDEAAGGFLSAPDHYALVTGTDEGNARARHCLYRAGALLAEYDWPRLAGEYHGTGCTLTSAITAFVARGCTVEVAVSRALCYTFAAVANAISIGGRQMLPNRLAAVAEIDND
ncbi:MAG: hydroxymethylpyrimidine/phosphomethylpyrimidine kinase [Gammaproteobacteria bacterium]|nr:hydroxymethylpyrimidine/phosphomethylpyrimidine kinase [Gammaproteobacteria bacterium]